MSKLNTRKRGKTWQYQFEAAKVDGKRKQITKSGFKTQKEALEAGTIALAEYNNSGLHFEPSEISMSDYLDYWLENYVELNLRTNTIAGYKGIIENYLKPSLGIYKLKSLTPSILQNYINKKYINGSSKCMLKRISSVLNLSLKYAVHPCKFIKENPMQYISMPKYEKKSEDDVKTITLQEFNNIIDRFPETTDYYLPLMIGFHTGCRIGEVLALTWEDIDFKNKTLSVNKSLIFNDKNKQWYFGPTKTFTSNRIIKIGDTLINILKKYKKKQMENKLKYGEYYKIVYSKEELINNKPLQRLYVLYANIPSGNLKHQNVICARIDGNLLTTNGMKYVSKVVNYELNIDFKFHSLRHTHATLLIQNGANIKDVQTRLGHASVETTLDTYTHSTEDSSRNTVDLFEQISKAK